TSPTLVTPFAPPLLDFADSNINFTTKNTYFTFRCQTLTPLKNLIFRFLQSKARIRIWLFEQKDLRIEGRIINLAKLII
ncbi:small nuclear ribonucleoprotein E-like, partial [Cucumis melo]|uniref:Small nuclear ribonucleoprotein E-like n=1 Tax=Cucumis melo TaxID=3656 RepID=A0ABM3L935_CUCME